MNEVQAHLRCLIDNYGWSVRGIARAANVSRLAITRALDGAATRTGPRARLLAVPLAPFVHPNSRQDVRTCAHCGGIWITIPSDKGRCCSRECAAANRPHRRVGVNGYIDINVPDHPLARVDGYVFEHRMVAYDAGLLVDPSQHVHHINHDKQDNRLENLEVLSVEEHARRHAAENGFIVNQFGTWPLHRNREGVAS